MKTFFYTKKVGVGGGGGGARGVGGVGVVDLKKGCQGWVMA